MLEASYLYQRQETGDLFIFVNYYWCCRGMDSTYDIDGRYTFSFDFMAIDSNDQLYRNQLRELSWDLQGWPVISNRSWFPAASTMAATGP